MENFTQISERIRYFIDFKNISLNKFSLLLGFSNSYFHKVLTQNHNIGSDKLEKILLTFPELNPEWLITGRGEMIRGMEEVGHKKSISNAGNAVNLIDSHKNNIKYNDEVINAKNREIQLLEKQIQLLEKQIQLLESKRA